MHKIRALCLLIRTETLQKAATGRGHERLGQNLLRSYIFRTGTGVCPYRKISNHDRGQYIILLKSPYCPKKIYIGGTKTPFA